MPFLMNCGVCCMLLSGWAVIQLGLMGIFYFVEATVLIEDAEAHIYDSYDDFLAKTRDNYKQLAINCWVTAVIYAFTMLMAYTCILKAKKNALRSAALLADDEYSCTTGLPKLKSKK